ncbi:MAG: VWA domain-containing protein [Planctomycetes bacterium]|nr:VWA domain-containing protein [Planctomycetota bacterium]
MGLEFDIPWLVVASAAVVLAAAGIAVKLRKPAAPLFALAGAAFLLAGARPSVGSEAPGATHAVVLDVSGSMAPRKAGAEAAIADALARVTLPASHSVLRYELSDALRAAGSPGGNGTDYSALAALRADTTVDGEVIVATDGRGGLADLLQAVDTRRLLLLRLPPAAQPDASVVDFTAPTAVADGGTALLRATIQCDADAQVGWKMLVGSKVVAQGTRNVKGGLAAGVSHSLVVPGSGLVRVRLVLEVAGDREPANDEASVAFYAGGRRVIAYCVPRDHPAAADGLLAPLRADPRNDVRVTNELPVTPSALEGVGALVINNLPLHESGATRDGLTVLRDWVMAGGNLLMLGADGAFGPGGYRGTALEDVMPVRFRPEDVPPHRLLLLLDVSESMGQLLPGGATKLDRLREAAERVLATAERTDAVAVVGFNQSVQGEIVFRRPDAPEHAATLGDLRAELSTRIRRSMSTALAALGSADDQQRRLLVITDGEDTSASQQEWLELADALAAGKVRADIVLTDAARHEWIGWLRDAPAKPDVHFWTAGSDGFSKLLETLDRALAGGDSTWVSADKWEVGGVPEPLHLLAKTALRADRSVTPTLTAQTPAVRFPEYPLLTHRQLVGRTACLCTRSWGDERLAAFWGTEFFQERLDLALEFILASAGRTNLVLNVLEQGAELVWVGTIESPARDLRLASGGTARLDRPGRWLLEKLPAGEEMQVFDGELLVQRIALPRLVTHELRRTGDDEVFFTMAAQAGVRVVSSLDAWTPTRIGDAASEPTDLTWVAALLALALLVGGFALRNRRS